ncbi:hypothetical protein [Streptomyces pseudovenezuelae]|uniref:Uncharacterized protein n=1 Tax=Streptomyces pseudovenezuelae TaxID=67350 RepID=A0ABT6LKT3_9ACTN|nr:hypothetical protein [Streptomyces pseudovenezuelae]MDH6216580.1 hypothetical protein [Streptomyces pseudovenezuelae]
MRRRQAMSSGQVPRSGQVTRNGQAVRYAGVLALRYAGRLAVRYAGALRPAPVPPPPALSAGRTLNQPQRRLPALRALLAALDDFSAAAAASTPSATVHEDDALRRCPTSRDHDTQGPRP